MLVNFYNLVAQVFFLNAYLSFSLISSPSHYKVDHTISNFVLN